LCTCCVSVVNQTFSFEKCLNSGFFLGLDSNTRLEGKYPKTNDSLSFPNEASLGSFSIHDL